MAVVERGPAKSELVLSEDERATLERWARRPKSAQRLALRCRIVLACATGASNMEVARELRVSRATVGKIAAEDEPLGLEAPLPLSHLATPP
jgi:DNA-binding NarL/FixJ family response regulator